ncbi:SPOSA6832_00671 [Sporobolomyces salmonicolor]|uniref:SPOSA6832_00671-mRNA-1:cds n=1 Tax=Sporidiobolus salmonicolor TaxID=5005 RepID=A0A0D6EGU4_SPOSA|nr:SPOSA6832_00671 [Sporobolomyces salmonicolor]
MLTALHCLSYVASAVGLVFVLLSLGMSSRFTPRDAISCSPLRSLLPAASGLLYIAEVIEEHSGLAKTVGQRLVYAVIFFFLVLYFIDGLPLQLIAAGILAHLVYLQNFSRNWPTISLTSPTFILSCLCVLFSHYISFRHFSARQSTATHHYTHYNAYNHRNTKAGGWGNTNEESFLDVATYFAVCVWLVPFYLFLSLSANDNVLPSAGMPPPPPLPLIGPSQLPLFHRSTPLPSRLDARRQPGRLLSRALLRPLLALPLAPHPPTQQHDEIGPLLSLLDRPLGVAPVHPVFLPRSFRRRRSRRLSAPAESESERAVRALRRRHEPGRHLDAEGRTPRQRRRNLERGGPS